MSGHCQECIDKVVKATDTINEIRSVLDSVHPEDMLGALHATRTLRKLLEMA